RSGSPADELDSVARLRQAPDTPTQLWDVLKDVFTTPVAQEVAAAGGDLTPLQRSWDEWLSRGASSPAAAQLESAPGPLLALLSSGLLRPTPVHASTLPTWTRIGAAERNPDLVITELLTRRPLPPSTVGEWIETAAWWGKIRATSASNASPSPIADHAWQAWQELNAQLGQWLRDSYGTTLLSASATPRAVHQIAPF